jgi:hypothetical protein
MGKELLEAARQAQLADILPRLGITPVHRRFECPVCQASGRSCGLMADGRRFHCFACETTGTLVEIALARCNADRVDRRVFEELEAILGGAAPERPESPKPEPPRRPKLTPAQVMGFFARCEGDVEVSDWLQGIRGIPVGGWRINNVPSYRPDLEAALKAGPCAVFPLWSTRPDAADRPHNLMVRPIRPTVKASNETKPWKGRLLVGGHGSASDGDWPLAYGEPHRLRYFPRVILVEGAVDTETMLAIVRDLEMRACVVGAFSADNLAKAWPAVVDWHREFWGDRSWWTVIPHLDPVRKGESVGVARARALAAGRRVQIFRWGRLLSALGWTFESFQAAGKTDLNDLVRTDQPSSVPYTELLKAVSQVLAGK